MKEMAELYLGYSVNGTAAPQRLPNGMLPRTQGPSPAKGIFEVEAPAGGTHLCGEGFNNCLVNRLISSGPVFTKVFKEFKCKNRKDLSTNIYALRRLRTAFERAQGTLSSATQTTVEIYTLYEGIDFMTTLTCARFQSQTFDIYIPRGFTFYLDDSLGSHNHRGPHRHWNLSGSPTSFVDLSDEEPSHDTSESTPSLVESFSPEKRAKAERRRKRDKLAKHHRFLGSRIPTDLIIDHIAGPSLPPTSMPEDSRDMWLHRRMSGPSALSFNRVEEELDDEEKALNVRCARKMEKVLIFSVARCLKRSPLQ
ncbi:HSP70-domain-containing protein [Rhizopogon salebrosus TDB-379]|nr:HSP70-domain-containing protein [Rhizopogon salebrosus TDB-379]